MKPIEKYADVKRCEMCGAVLTCEGVDPKTEHPAAEVVRRLSFLADKYPALALLLIHHVAGRTVRQIATATGLPRSTVHRHIARVGQEIKALS